MIEIVFSTFNGKNTLPRTLDSFCKLNQPSSSWRIIAVNNGSIDNTAEILNFYKEKLPIIIINEPNKGKNYALNTALNYINSDLLVFTDDDVVVPKNWLVNIERCTESNPSYDIFGGAIIPRWPIPPTDLILKYVDMGIIYAVTNPSWRTGAVNEINGAVWGPNMWIRSHLFSDKLKFTTNVGPNGSHNYIMGSETELVNRLKEKGKAAWFCAELVVEHLIRQNQMDINWILQRYYRAGRSSYLLDNNHKNKSVKIFGADRWLYRRLIVAYFQSIYYKILRDDENDFLIQKIIYKTKGSIFQSKQS